VRPDRLRILLVGTFIVAAVLSGVGRQEHSPFVEWLGYACFLVGVCIYVSWRREIVRLQRGRVLDREAKTPDETGTGTDQ
jgi:hypothetical protein